MEDSKLRTISWRPGRAERVFRGRRTRKARMAETFRLPMFSMPMKEVMTMRKSVGGVRGGEPREEGGGG